MQGLHGYAWQVGDLPANHRASGCALECCLEGLAALDGHKSMPSRERMCPGVLSRGFAVLDRLTIPAMTLREIHLEP